MNECKCFRLPHRPPESRRRLVSDVVRQPINSCPVRAIKSLDVHARFKYTSKPIYDEPSSGTSLVCQIRDRV